MLELNVNAGHFLLYTYIKCTCLVFFFFLFLYIRYIIDGPGSMTVFNGEMELVDMLYTRSNGYMAGNLTKKIYAKPSFLKIFTKVKNIESVVLNLDRYYITFSHL